MMIKSYCRKVTETPHDLPMQEMALVAIDLVKGSESYKCFVMQCIRCGHHQYEAIPSGVEITIGEKV